MVRLQCRSLVRLHRFRAQVRTVSTVSTMPIALSSTRCCTPGIEIMCRGWHGLVQHTESLPKCSIEQTGAERTCAHARERSFSLWDSSLSAREEEVGERDVGRGGRAAVTAWTLDIVSVRDKTGAPLTPIQTIVQYPVRVSYTATGAMRASCVDAHQ